MLVTEHGAARPGAFQLYGEAGGSPGAGLTDAEARHALGLNVHVLLLALRRAILALKGRWSSLSFSASCRAQCHSQALPTGHIFADGFQEPKHEGCWQQLHPAMHRSK